MINASTVRENNYVKANNLNQRRSSGTVFKVCQIDLKEMEGIDPIDLTEDWFNTLGFTREAIGIGYKYFRKWDKDHYLIIHFNKKRNLYFIPSGKDKDKTFKFTHDLQNYYNDLSYKKL